MCLYGRIPYISVSLSSDGVTLTYTDVAELSVNGDLLYYSDVNISSSDDVTDDVATAQVCFVATDDFEWVLVETVELAIANAICPLKYFIH